ncbi:endonuclease III-like protein [Lactobacillus selangorensis]|uniref:Endonuclease III-like protein n=1 Tax=Lactobacillus selangorensis TaxID=81857 RepID=A0A0R2FUV8_9LACO|nr:endonuclease III [Lactobacillus selangorensis]KRN29020.1 endonuclease III-like protein [Lactobacillus selangorensis]KRN32570.1 endonuclease III-like protein [Lactobacillus selangorensis]
MTALSLQQLYQHMNQTMGPQEWLQPGTTFAQTPWEVMWGAILIQNTNWRNVIPALQNLEAKTAFEPQRVLTLSEAKVAEMIHSSGFYTRKAATLLAVASWTQRYDFDLTKMRQTSGKQLRTELLALRGIGPETADYILMYVLDVPHFMADKYAQRLFTQLGATYPNSYAAFQKKAEAQLQLDLAGYQNFHALIDNFEKSVRTTADFQASFLNEVHLVF